MNKRWVVVGIVALLVVMGVIAVVTADRKYCVFRSPEFSHAPYVIPDTRVQIAVWPGRGQEALMAFLQTALPEKPLVLGPGYDKNPEAYNEDGTIRMRKACAPK